ncbi:MAG: hypothetical protein QM758_08740 [Armatimonas sp.]
MEEAAAPLKIYHLGLWIWWHRLVACFVGIFTLFTLIMTGLIWQQALISPTVPQLMLVLTTVLMSAVLILVAVSTLLRGRERASWIVLEPGDTLLVRTLNGNLRRVPLSAVGKRQYRREQADEHTGFTYDDPRLVLPITDGPSLYIDLMDGYILEEEEFQRVFRWSRERPPVGGGKRPNRHKKEKDRAA